MYTNRCVNERTSLTRPLDSPDYVEFASLLRSRKTRIRQFQCCICATLIVVVVSTTTSANGGDMPSSEKTSLTGDNPSRIYYGQDALPFYSHRRRRQLLRIRCIAYTIAVAIFTMALVVTVSYSVSHDMMDAGPNLTAPSFESNANLTRSLKKLKLGFAPGSGSYTLFSNPSIAPSNSIFVPGQQPSRETVTNRGLSKEEVREGLKAGRQAVTERLFTDASTSPLTSPSPETRHRHAVSTCVDAGTLALAAVAELAATRKIEKLRESQGEPSAVGSFFDAGWKIFGACKQLTTPDCPPTAKYRTFDGSCNRPMQMGAAMTPFIRHLPPNYGDGINSPRRAVSGADLPSAREVSLIVHKPSPSSNPSFTVMLAVYGQFLDHDITATALSQGLNGTSIPCCPPSDAHPECFPVPVSSGDPVFDVAGRTCMDFVRSAPAPQCKLGPRQQLNQVSAFIDGSMIYGTEKNAAENLREFRGGRLRMQLTPDNRTLLPPSTDPNDGCNRETERRRGRYCFAAGDARANENLHLTTMHLLWARQHNRVAERLARINPSWDDQTLYEESRRVIGAQLQHVTYREFVPIVLGDEETDKRDLRPLRSGHREEWKLDDATVDPSIANSFATAAFRFAHTLLPGLMRMTDERAGTSSYVELHRMLFNPYSLYAESGLRSSIASATGNVIQMTSAHVTSQLTNHLFEDPIANTSVPCGLDLVSLNIQRGRDHGLPGYTAWREYCGLGRAESFSDLDGHLDPRTLEDISSLYESVHDIDLYTGALAELPNAGSIVGSTFMCLIADQFVRLQRGDRFWYELGGQPHSFTEDQLTELRKMSLARLICDCSDEIGQIQAEVMRAIGPENPVISCEDIPAPSYEPWKEIERESFNWTGLRNDINNTIEEIVAYINNSRTNLDNDWAAFKNYVSDTFTDLRNQLSELHPTNDSQETQTPKERSDFETGEAYRYWNGLKGNVTRWLNRSMRTMTGGPAAVTKWMAFKRSVVDQFANLKEQIAATRADIAPKLATKKRYEQVSSNSSRISDAIPAIFDWKNFKSNIISSLNDTITDMKDDKMPPPIDDQATSRGDKDSAFEIDSQRSVEQESNVSSDWLAYKDQIVKTVNEIVDKIKNGMPPPGDPAWATYRNEIIKSFSNFETISPSLERATLFNARENVPFHGSSVVTSNDVSNLTLDWSEFRARINDSVTRMMEDILSKRPTEIDPIAWATFRVMIRNEFAGLRSEIGSIKDEWLEIGRGENSSNLRANWFEYNYSDPFVVPSREEWDEFKKGINDTVMNILIIANSSDEFSFDELHKMFNRSFADLKNQLSSLRTLIEETYNNETAADWLIFQAQLNSTVKYLVDGLTANDELSIEDATDVLLKAEDELSNVRLPANSAAIPPTDWIRYASHVNKTISDALRNINETGRNHHGTMMLRAEETVVTSSSSSNDPEKIRTNWLIVPCLLASFATVSKFQIRV